MRGLSSDTEDASKNHHGELKERKNRSKKLLFIIENTDNSSCCFVWLYKFYLNKCPPNRPPNVFYLQSLKNPTNDCCWFSSVPIGHATLVGTIARLCKPAGIPGYKTHHSLQATAATHLYHSGVDDEQLIMEKTGHCSLE